MSRLTLGDFFVCFNTWMRKKYYNVTDKEFCKIKSNFNVDYERYIRDCSSFEHNVPLRTSPFMILETKSQTLSPYDVDEQVKAYIDEAGSTLTPFNPTNPEIDMKEARYNKYYLWKENRAGRAISDWEYICDPAKYVSFSYPIFAEYTLPTFAGWYDYEAVINAFNLFDYEQVHNQDSDYMRKNAAIIADAHNYCPLLPQNDFVVTGVVSFSNKDSSFLGECQQHLRRVIIRHDPFLPANAPYVMEFLKDAPNFQVIGCSSLNQQIDRRLREFLQNILQGQCDAIITDWCTKSKKTDSAKICACFEPPTEHAEAYKALLENLEEHNPHLNRVCVYPDCLSASAYKTATQENQTCSQSCVGFHHITADKYSVVQGDVTIHMECGDNGISIINSCRTEDCVNQHGPQSYCDVDRPGKCTCLPGYYMNRFQECVPGNEGDDDVEKRRKVYQIVLPVLAVLLVIIMLSVGLTRDSSRFFYVNYLLVCGIIFCWAIFLWIMPSDYQYWYFEK